MFSPITVGDVTGAALAPMAVLPEHQRSDIGSKLVEAGNRKLDGAGDPFIIVLGHANYYPRFGFVPASRLGIACEWEVPDDVFMVLPLDQAKMQGVSGLAKYRHEFSTPWGTSSVNAPPYSIPQIRVHYNIPNNHHTKISCIGSASSNACDRAL